MPVAGAEFAHQVDDLGLHGDVERGGRLVGDQQIRPAGERNGDHHALAHAAGELVRVVFTPPLGRRNAHTRQHLDRSWLASRQLLPLCRTNISAICRPTGETGLSAVIGS